MIALVVLLPLVTQSMNFAASPLGTPLVTIQKLRTPAVLAGLGVAQVAGDALVADGVDARGVGEGDEADRLAVGRAPRSARARWRPPRWRSGRSSGFRPGRCSGRRPGYRRRRRGRTGRSGRRRWRPGLRSSRGVPGEDAFDASAGRSWDGVLGVGDHADAVARDLREDEAFGVDAEIGSREESPMSKRPLAAPLMPMSDCPPSTFGVGDLAGTAVW